MAEPAFQPGNPLSPALESAADQVSSLIGELRQSPTRSVPPAEDLTISLPAMDRQLDQADEGLRALRALRAQFLEWDFTGSRVAVEFAIAMLERDQGFLRNVRSVLQGGQE